MGGWTGFYICTTDKSAEGASRKIFPPAISGRPVKIEPDKDFIRVDLGTYWSKVPSADFAKLSLDFDTDVIWLRFHNGTETFEFHHWRAGNLLRSLVFGCYEKERTWERVEGTAEPWEREAIFDSRNLQCALEDAKSNEAKQELERIWREAEILPGRTEPGLSSEYCMEKVQQYYHFPL
jgi:hypothetical protein